MTNTIVNGLQESIDIQIEVFRKKMEGYLLKGKRVIASSSFQSHSIPMLHILASIAPETPVYFLDTGYHFPETYAFRDEIADKLGLNVMDVRSTFSKAEQRDTFGRLMWASDPDRCCFLNKTLPMDPVLAENDIWISGVRKDQSATRKTFSLEATGPHNILRFHPMLEWNNRMIWQYIRLHSLPKHPLDAQGYQSIGCLPCTRKPSLEGRDGRWAGLNKTECGLHTELIES